MYHVNGILAFISSNSFTRSQIKKALLSMEYRAPSGYVTQKSENKVDINNLKESKSEVFGCTAPFIYKKRNTDIFFHGSIYSPESFNLELNDITRDLGEVTDKLSKVDGSFSFVTIDNDKMICGRDLLGTKPLYISRNSKSVIVSSEPEAIISLGANNIEYFQPGEINKFTIKTKEVKRIPNKIKRNKQDINMDEASSKVLEMIEKSVQNRAKKYKKVAIASSGGIDSSLLTIITKKYTEVEIIPLSLEGSSDRVLEKKLAEFIEEFEIKEFEDMERISKGEQERIIKMVGWESKVVPRPITALSVFITLSRFLEKYDWVEYFEKAVFEILGRNNYVADEGSLQAKESLIL